jgi:hypothetical protein
LKAKILGLIVIVLVLVAGAGYYLTSIGPTTSVTTSRANRPPKADFEIKPKYINPTNETIIKFINKSTDPDADPLTFTWLIDGQPVSQDKDYATRLRVGRHQIQLRVTDGQTTASNYEAITVEPDQIYPAKNIRIKIKGMKYAVGRAAPELTVTPKEIPNHEKMVDQLGTIHDEMGCNAVYLQAGAEYEDNLFDACEIAIQKQFDHIYPDLKFMHTPLDETVERLRKLAPRMAVLREKSPSITWVIGSEYVFQIKDIIPGNTFQEQTAWMYANNNGYITRMRENIPQVFRRIIPVIKANYPYPVAYAAEVNEAQFVPWNDPIFECVGTDAYLQDAWGANEAYLINYFSNLKRFGIPVIDFEFGCKAFTGAGAQTGYPPGWNKAPYDENEQANYIDRYCAMQDRAGIDGIFYYIYNEEWDRGFGLYNGMSRKRGFYMYKSYVLDNPSSTVKSGSEKYPTIPSLSLASNWLTQTTPSLMQLQTTARNSRVKSWVQ